MEENTENNNMELNMELSNTYVLPFSDFQLIKSDENFDYYECNEIQYMYHRQTGYLYQTQKNGENILFNKPSEEDNTNNSESIYENPIVRNLMIELSYSKHNIQNLLNELNTLKFINNDLTQSLMSLHISNIQLDTMYNVENNQINNLSNENICLIKRCSQMEFKYKNLVSKMNQFKRENDLLKEENEELKRNNISIQNSNKKIMDDLKNNISSLRNNISGLNNTIREKNTVIESLQNSLKNKPLSVIIRPTTNENSNIQKEEIERLLFEIENFKNVQNENMLSIHDYRNKNHENEMLMEEYKNEIFQLKREKEGIIRKMDEKVQKRTEMYQNELLTLKQQFELESVQHRLLQQKMSQNEKRFIQYENSMKELRSQMEEEKVISNLLNDNITNLQNSVNEWKDKYENVSKILNKTIENMKEKVNEAKKKGLEEFLEAEKPNIVKKYEERFNSMFELRINKRQEELNEEFRILCEKERNKYNTTISYIKYSLKELYELRRFIRPELFNEHPEIINLFKFAGIDKEEINRYVEYIRNLLSTINSSNTNSSV